jgi:UDP-N-acetylmuramate dehydrogenase
MTQVELVRKDELPKPRGRLEYDVRLGAQTWFRVGGKAEILFRPEDEEDLAFFLKALPAHIPVTVIGVASNLIIRDGGIKGVVIKLGKNFAKLDHDGEVVMAGAAALDMNVAIYAMEAGLAGLAFLSGIPGTIGGAVRMNAGAYGGEMADILITAEAVDRMGARHSFTPQAMGLSYRHNAVSSDYIFTKAVMQGRAGNKAEIAREMAEIKDKRGQTQPIRAATGGSTFANPKGDKKAWQLIDEAGCRGLTRGGAMISELHCNFMINTGDATAADLEDLGEEVRARVFDKTGVMLEWEIRRVGERL